MRSAALRAASPEEKKRLVNAALDAYQDAERSGVASAGFHFDVGSCLFLLDRHDEAVQRWYRADGRLPADEVCDRMADAALNLVCFRNGAAA